MKKTTLKKISIIMIITILIFSMLQIKSFASGKYTSNDPTVTSGENVSITINSSELLQNYDLSISSNGGLTLLNVVANNAAVNNQTGQISFATLETGVTKLGTYTFKTPEVSSTSTYKVVFNVNGVSNTSTVTVKAKQTTPTTPSDGDSEPVTGGDTNKGDTSGQTPTTNPNNPTTSTDKSRNNSLKSLTINQGTLSPTFYRDTTDYSVKFDDDFDLKSLKSIKITAKAEDSKAKVSGDGTINLNDGENNIKINVTAENGQIKAYNIKIIKPIPLTQSDIKLKTLEVNKIDKDGKFIKATLDKEFSPETLEYKCDVESNITDLDVTATVENEGIIVTIDGIKNLKSGENLATIKLTSKDDETVQTIYTIKITKEAELQEATNIVDTEKSSPKLESKTVITIIVAVISVLALILIILMIINNRKKKNNIKYTNHNSEDDLDNLNDNKTEENENSEIINKLDGLENESNSSIEIQDNKDITEKLSHIDENNKKNYSENEKIDISKLENDDNKTSEDEYEKIQKIMHPKITLEPEDQENVKINNNANLDNDKKENNVFKELDEIEDKNPNRVNKNHDSVFENKEKNLGLFNDDTRIEFDGKKEQKEKHKGGKHF